MTNEITNAVNSIAQSSNELNSAADAIPLALTGMGVVFTALALISLFLVYLPKILKVLAPYLPPEQPDLVPGAAHGTAASALAARAPDASPDGRPPPELAAAIAAALHRHR